MPLLHLTKAGFLAPAPLGGIRTARVKTAAGRRIFRTGNIALKQNALGLFTDGGDGNGGEQRLRVGVGRGSKEILRTGQLDDFSQIHDGDAV